MPNNMPMKSVDCFGPSVDFDSINDYFYSNQAGDRISVVGSTVNFTRNEITGFTLVFEASAEYGVVNLEEFKIENTVLEPQSSKFTHYKKKTYELCTAIEVNVCLEDDTGKIRDTITVSVKLKPDVNVSPIQGELKISFFDEETTLQESAIPSTIQDDQSAE